MTLTISALPGQTASLSQGHLFEGRYIAPYRSNKGKLKGLTLQIGAHTYDVKLPKYLRPMLVRELEPGTFIQLWAYFEAPMWRGVNVLPLSTAEAERVQRQWQESPPERLGETSLDLAKATNGKTNAPKACIQVCRKGKCFKQGSKHIWSTLQAEVEANPDLKHVSIEATGCMKACKKGPNLKVLPKGKMHTGMTPEQALNVLGQCQ